MAFRSGWCSLSFCFTLLLSGVSHAQVSVPEAPPPTVKPQEFRDGHFGVRFVVPQGWSLARRDKEVSTFHLDARSASPKALMRSVAAIEFNPYPYSTFSGALFYFSVEPHSTDLECARQATTVGSGMRASTEVPVKDIQDIDGMSFAHGHDEHGKICVEARDEVYTAYRKGACYRFDMTMNTFCSVSSGAEDMTETQLEQIDQRMADILSTVKLDWEKDGPHPVPGPKVLPALPPMPGGVHTASVRVPTGGPFAPDRSNLSAPEVDSAQPAGNSSPGTGARP